MLGLCGLAKILHRRTALVVGLICLWLSTAGSLHHDELFNFVSHRAGQSTLRQVGPITQHGPCVACEWEQMVGASQTVDVATFMMPGLVAPEPPERLAANLILRQFDYTSLRAPPVSLS